MMFFAYINTLNSFPLGSNSVNRGIFLLFLAFVIVKIVFSSYTNYV